MEVELQEESFHEYDFQTFSFEFINQKLQGEARG